MAWRDGLLLMKAGFAAHRAWAGPGGGQGNNGPGLRGHSRSLELGDAEDGLHDGAEVAAVAQVLEPRVPGAIHGLQLRPRLLDHFPLADPRLDVIVPEPILCLGQSHGRKTTLAVIIVGCPVNYF